MASRTCIYIASRMSEARQVEEVLRRVGIDYAVEVAPYRTRRFGLLPIGRRAAMFYVMTVQARFCRQALERAGLKQGL